MKTSFPLYGFTFMRGVERFDYPYLEMLENLRTLTDKVCVALGPAQDDTEKNVRAIDDLEIVDSPWDEGLVGDGGKIFSYQANVALKKLRELYGEDDDAWAFFLHCDEIIHPDDYERVYQDLRAARESGCDAVSFRFLHFWDDHYHIAISKRWHPSEIRAMKLRSKIECWGDAQGFQHATKVFESDVCIITMAMLETRKNAMRSNVKFCAEFVRPKNLRSTIIASNALFLKRVNYPF